MQLVTTEDGSHTLFVPQLNEHYHSTFGAITESMHIFIRAGLDQLHQKNISVFEIGFGTGLNALLTCLAAIDRKLSITYHSIEKFPLSTELAGQLNYPEMLPPVHDPRGLFDTIHHAPWNEMTKIHAGFYLHKILAGLQEYHPAFACELIYFDAFSPEVQPEMWTPRLFKCLHDTLVPGGILTTYCVKGTVKRTLEQAGFLIEKLPGPKGKREMLRGRKQEITTNFL